MSIYQYIYAAVGEVVREEEQKQKAAPSFELSPVAVGAVLASITGAPQRRSRDESQPSKVGSDPPERRHRPRRHELVRPAVSFRVLRLPVPEIAAHRLERLRRVEPELFARDGGVRDQFGDVASSIHACASRQNTKLQNNV